MSASLRAAGLPRHSLRFRDSDDAFRESAMAILAPVVSPDQLDRAIADALALSGVRGSNRQPVHGHSRMLRRNEHDGWPPRRLPTRWQQRRSEHGCLTNCRSLPSHARRALFCRTRPPVADSNAALSEEQRAQLVSNLMAARRDIGIARRTGDRDAERAARVWVDHAKRDLGERGPVWWENGAPDYNRHMARNTLCAGWFAALK